MAEYKPTTSEESSQEENIESSKVEKKYKKGCLLGCIGLPAFLAIISALIVPNLNIGLWPMSANSSRAKNVLVIAMKNCNIKFFEGIDKPTFEDIGCLFAELSINPFLLGIAASKVISNT